MRYRRTKRDGNHSQIVGALRSIGVSVLDLAAVGGGCPDLLCGFQGRNVLLEVKRPGDKIRNDVRGDLQRDFFAEWRGPAYVVQTVEEAIDAVNGFKRPRP